MKKIGKKSFKVMGAVGGLAGGAIVSLADEVFPPDFGETTKAAITAVVGAGISAFTKGELLQGVGAGMIGAAGYKLYNSLTTDTPTPVPTGVGAYLPSRHAIGQNSWINRRTAGTTVAATNPVPTGQRNIM